MSPHLMPEYTNAAVNNSSISCLMFFHGAEMSRCFMPRFKSALSTTRSVVLAESLLQTTGAATRKEEDENAV